MHSGEMTQAQREILADLLVLAMCIDGHFSLAEEEKLQAKIESAGWEENHSPTPCLHRAISRARDAVDSAPQVQGILERAAEVPGSQGLKKLVCEMVQKVLPADGLHHDEGRFLAQMKSVFKI